MVTPMVIQTILLDPSGPIQADVAPNVSRHDPTSTVQSDAEHLARNRGFESLLGLQNRRSEHMAVLPSLALLAALVIPWART
jgi:hypothetical protein